MVTKRFVRTERPMLLGTEGAVREKFSMYSFLSFGTVGELIGLRYRLAKAERRIEGALKAARTRKGR